MRLNDLDSLIQELNVIQETLSEKRSEQEEAKGLVYERKREAERLKKLSSVTGKTYDLETVSEKIQTKEIAAEISKLVAEETKLKMRIAKGISELQFPMKSPNPEISNGDATFYLEEGDYQNAIKYLKSSLNMRERLVIDNVVIYPDKIVIRGKSEAGEATDSFINAVQSIWALGSIMLGEVPKEMKGTIDSLNQSKHKRYWEFIGSRGKTSLENTYENFKLMDGAERKRARTFYSQLESLRTPPLVKGDGKGNYELTTYGRLVWASYKKTHVIQEEKIEEAERIPKKQEEEKVQPQEEKKKLPQTALQNFMEKVLLEEGD